MSIELYRLRAWMDRNEHTSKSLVKAFGLKRDFIYRMLIGRSRITLGFEWRFVHTFGLDAYEQVFGPYPDPTDYTAKVMAQYAVADAVKRGVLASAAKLKCAGCDKMADDYHHESYKPSDYFCVVPLCHTCHRCHHTGKRRLNFGIVPTCVGIVRIAIASANRA